MAAGSRRVPLEIGELPPGRTRAMAVAGHDILVCNVDGVLYAVANRCTHAKVALTNATLIGCDLECPVHGARFDVRSGAVKSRPARKPLRSYPVTLGEDGLLICLDEA